jgi:O-antigen ligase
MGSGSGSALWRIQHWRDIVVAYSKGTTVEQVFGFGPGSSIAVVEILPHNEYLRMLFEEGLVGLALFLFAWYGIVKTAPPGIRYVALAIAIYSFSENNLDNFPFMALFALCLSANVTINSAVREIVRRPAWEGSSTRITGSPAVIGHVSARQKLLLS